MPGTNTDKLTGLGFNEYAPPSPLGPGGGGFEGPIGGGRFYKMPDGSRVWVDGNGEMWDTRTGEYKGEWVNQTESGGGGGGIPFNPFSGGSGHGPSIPVPPQMAPPGENPVTVPDEPLAGEVPEGPGKLPPWLAPFLPYLPEVVNQLPHVGEGVPDKNGFNIPDWLEKLLKGLLLAGALAPPGDGGGGGPTIQGGEVVGGGSSLGSAGIGTTGYRGMRGGGNFVGWNPGAGQRLIGGGGGGGQSTGDMIATLFAGRR